MKTLVLNNYDASCVAWLKTQKTIELVESSQDVEAILIRSQTKVDKAFLDKYPKLKIVITATSGFDHIHWRECEERGIFCAYSPNSNADSAAEHTLMLTLNLLRNYKEQISNIRAGQWRTGLQRGKLLKDRTFGVVGLGRIGQRVARMAQAFGAKVIAHDPFQSDDVFEDIHISRLGLTEVFREVDILSLHVPYTKQTHHLINKATIGEMSDHTFLINISRGNMVEESDLVTALHEGHLAGAALDVFSKEPMDANSFLLKEKKLLVTPHMGAFTEEAWANSSMEAAQTLVEFSKGQAISNTLPISAPWFKESLV